MLNAYPDGKKASNDRNVKSRTRLTGSAVEDREAKGVE